MEYEWLTKLLDKLTDKIQALIFLLGVVLLIFGANEGYKKADILLTSGWSFLIAFVGVSLIAVVCINFFRIAPRKLSQKKLQKEYGIKITHPIAGNSENTPIAVSGTFSHVPPRDTVQLFELNPATGFYFPKDVIQVDEAAKTWESTMRIGGGDNRARKLVVAYLGENSKKLVNYYRTASGETGRHIGIRSMPDDFIELGFVRITLLA